MTSLLDLALKHLRGTHWSQEDAAVLIDVIQRNTATNIVQMDVDTTEVVPPKQVILGAMREHLDEPFKRVLIIGMRGENYTDEYFAASESDAGNHLYDMERLKNWLMKEADKRVSESH